MPLIGLGKADRRFTIGKGKANLKMIGLGRGRRRKGKAGQRLGWAIEYTDLQGLIYPLPLTLLPQNIEAMFGEPANTPLMGTKKNNQ
jgi:hypothetical protein